MKEEKEKKLC